MEVWKYGILHTREPTPCVFYNFRQVVIIQVFHWSLQLICLSSNLITVYLSSLYSYRDNFFLALIQKMDKGRTLRKRKEKQTFNIYLFHLCFTHTQGLNYDFH